MPDVQERKQEQAGFTWEKIIHDPNLRDLPYKIETNEYGQIVMSPPAAPKHGGRQSTIAGLLEEHLPDGKSVTECPVQTPQGTKAPDVVWFSAERWKQAKKEIQSTIAPEICVEVLSPSNAEAEMSEKRVLYFEAGAEEVWLCDENGQMQFFDADGEREASGRAPNFPKQVEI